MHPVMPESFTTKKGGTPMNRRTHRRSMVGLTGGLLTIFLLQAQTLDPALRLVQDIPGLPRVLLIGDSNSQGYTLPVREMLKGLANVHRPPVNCGDTGRGLRLLDVWLGTEPWHVIHFNFGLHDLHTYAEAHLEEIQRPRTVHFTEEGSRKLAEQVAASIRQQLSR
jgi:hypothetical protein